MNDVLNYTNSMPGIGLKACRLPEDLIPYMHQIAGHGITSPITSDTSDIKKPQLLHNPVAGHVYKPVQTFPKGRREVLFYDTVFNQRFEAYDSELLSSWGINDWVSSVDINTISVLKKLQKFLPTYHGFYVCPKSNVEYIEMEDILRSYLRPSVIDLKMGSKSYEPEAPTEKIVSEKKKFFHRETIGFLVTGIKVWDPVSEAYLDFDKQYGRKLTPENVYPKAIEPLFSKVQDPLRACRLLDSALEQLFSLLDWFQSQTLFHFYASSILICFEGSEPADSSSSLFDNSFQNKEHCQSSKAMVRFIDFTHAIPGKSKCDDGFIFGLQYLISIFRRYRSHISSR